MNGCGNAAFVASILELHLCHSFCSILVPIPVMSAVLLVNHLVLIHKILGSYYRVLQRRPGHHQGEGSRETAGLHSILLLCP